MCFSKNLSLISFLFGIISSLILIFFGDKNTKLTNLSIGIFFIFVSLMQFIEFLIWSDINCINGLNNLASIIGPLFNYIQPVIFFILLYIYIKPKIIIPMNLIIFINILYISYIIYKYYYYIQNNNNLCIKINDEGHLSWSWNQNTLFYFILVFINIINFIHNKNILITFILSLLLLIISFFNFKKNVGEIWCLIVSGIPISIFILQNFFL